MKINKITDIAVFDNLYSKPPLSGAHQRFSMSVLFDVEGHIYGGQYCWETNTWGCSFQYGDGKMCFKDNEVRFWFYPPFSKDLFENYSKEVKSHRCTDETSRLDEFDDAKDSLKKYGTKKIKEVVEQE